MFISVLVRRLRPDKSYDDFLEAWYPSKGLGLPVRGPVLARNIEDDREILTLAFLDVESVEEVADGLGRVAAEEAVRHDRIADVLESTSVRGVYELVAEHDFSTDESVARGRP